MNRKLIFIAGLSLALSSVAATAQEASARTVQYHSQDIVPIHAKLKYTTLIEVPPTEKIMSASRSHRCDTASHALNEVSQPSSLVRAVNSETLSVGA